MKAVKNLFIVVCLSTLGITELSAQMGMGMGNRFGRQRSSIPQAQEPPSEPEKLTAEEMVDIQMPSIVETIDLDPFEQAVVRSILVNSVQKRMELQILKLPADKMREEFEKIANHQDKELKAGLPNEKYEAFQKLLENPEKTKREAKKKRKNKKNNTEG